MGIEPNDSFERHTRAEAAGRNWKFEKIQGDMGMIYRLLNGQWDEREFLVVPPGYHLAAKHDGSIMCAQPPEQHQE